MSSRTIPTLQGFHLFLLAPTSPFYHFLVIVFVWVYNKLLRSLYMPLSIIKCRECQMESTNPHLDLIWDKNRREEGLERHHPFPTGPSTPAEFYRVQMEPHKGPSLCPGRTCGFCQSSGQPPIKTRQGFCIVLITRGHGDHQTSWFTNPSCRHRGLATASLLTQPWSRPATSSLIFPRPLLYICVYLFNKILAQALKAEKKRFPPSIELPGELSVAL